MKNKLIQEQERHLGTPPDTYKEEALKIISEQDIEAAIQFVKRLGGTLPEGEDPGEYRSIGSHSEDGRYYYPAYRSLMTRVAGLALDMS
jgi:hypothetical protein